MGKKTSNTKDSLVVTDPTTILALTGLSSGEQTGSRVFQWVWSLVVEEHWCDHIHNQIPDTGRAKSHLRRGDVAGKIHEKPGRQSAW